MSLAGRSVVTMDDLSNDEIESVFSLADGMGEAVSEQTGVCQGKIMASLFFEPSTTNACLSRPPCTGSAARVITASDVGATRWPRARASPTRPGWSGSYADIIVIRHPWEGAAKVVADYAGIPVINAGDGGHQHPTQTLLDLYTLIEGDGRPSRD